MSGRRKPSELLWSCPKRSGIWLSFPRDHPGLPLEVGEAVSALMGLGFSFSAADSAVREAFKGGDLSTEELIRRGPLGPGT